MIQPLTPPPQPVVSPAIYIFKMWVFQVYSEVIPFHIQVYRFFFFFQILFPYRLVQNIEYYTIGWLSILYTIVYI